MVTRHAASVLLISAVFFAQAFPVQAARVLDHYDLDSLVYMSESIIRGEVGAGQQFKTADGDCTVFEIKALEILKGPIKPGQSFRVTGLDEYRRAPGILDAKDSSDPIQKGEIVYLFLVPNGKMGHAKYRLTNADWTIIESGARLLTGDHVYAFGQYEPPPGVPTSRPALPVPYGFITMTQTYFPGAPVPTQKDFADRLKLSQQTVAQIFRLLEGPPAREQFDECVKLLRQRPATLRAEQASNDRIASSLLDRVLPFAEPALLDELRRDAQSETRFSIELALQSSRGRAYLLHDIADPKDPLEHRLEFANILASAGNTYVSECTAQRQGKLKDISEDFATQLARLAVANLGSPLSDPLLRGIADCRWGPEADRKAAADLLADTCPKAVPHDQFLIGQTLMQLDYNVYRRLFPGSQSLLSLVEPGSDFAAALKRRELHMTSRYRTSIAIGFPPAQLKLVLQPLAGGPDLEFPLEFPLPARLNTFGSSYFRVPIPDETPSGKYHILLRASQNNRSLSDGLGFDTEIPAK